MDTSSSSSSSSSSSTASSTPDAHTSEEAHAVVSMDTDQSMQTETETETQMAAAAALSTGSSEEGQSPPASSPTSSSGNIQSSNLPPQNLSLEPLSPSSPPPAVSSPLSPPSPSSSPSPPSSSPSPTGQKRHITRVLNPYLSNVRSSAPSPPKSPVRLRERAEAAGGGGEEERMGGLNAGTVPAKSSSLSESSTSSDIISSSSSSGSGSSSSGSDSSTRSPIRIGGRGRSHSQLAPSSASTLPASAYHSPTRSRTNSTPSSPGLPPTSPLTPSRRRLAGAGIGSPPFTAATPPPRSPIGAFYFPHGMPASPSTRLHAHTTLSQLAAAHPKGFDAESIEELTNSILKMPRFLAPYVRQQCLAIQRNKAELQQIKKKIRQQEIARKRMQRRMEMLRRSGGGPSHRHASLLGSNGGQSEGGSSDVSLSGLHLDNSLQSSSVLDEITSPLSLGRSALAGESPSPAPPSASAAAATASLLRADAESRERNSSTTSTASSARTLISAPTSPHELREADVPQETNEERELLEMDALQLTSADTSLAQTPSASRTFSAATSPNASLLQISSHMQDVDEEDTNEEEEGEGAGAETGSDEEELVLSHTFLYYFEHYLSQFKDLNTRFFRILLGAVDYLMDSPKQNDEATAAAAAEQPSSETTQTASVTAASPSQQPLPSLHLTSPLSSSFSLRSPKSFSSPINIRVTPPSHIPSLSPHTTFLLRSHFDLLLDSILASHPGLSFLHATPEFQSKYSRTCIERIFFTLDTKGHGRLSLHDLKKSNLLAEVQQLECDEDINRSMHYFSYQHFYVLYCKFWELDSPDHDGFLTLGNLLDYEGGALSLRICERIIAQCETNREEAEMAMEQAHNQSDTSSQVSDASSHPALHIPRMSYAEFIPFHLAEVDKSSPASLAYWFRLLDLDNDHVLSLYELDYFFREQGEKIQALSTDVIRWSDIVCQLLDMIKGGNRQEEQRHGMALPPAGAAFERGQSADVPPISRSTAIAAPRSASDSAASSSLTPSSFLPFELSDVHITRKDLARSHLASYFFNCFPAEDHQLLTEHGFMFLQEIEQHFQQHPSLSVACYVEEGKLQYHPLTADRLLKMEGKHRIVKMEREGAHKEAPALSICATDNHRMWARVSTKGQQGPDSAVPFAFHTAAELYEMAQQHPASSAQFLAAFEKGVATPVPSLPFAEPLGLQTQDESAAFLQLYGYWQVRGSLCHSERAILLSPRDAQEVKFLDQLWTQLQPALPSETAILEQKNSQLPTYSIRSPPWWHVFAQKEVESRTPSSPSLASWVWQLDAAHLRHFLSGLAMASAGGSSKLSTVDKPTELTVRTPSISFRDQLMRLAMHAGYASSFTSNKNETDADPSWAVHLSRSPSSLSPLLSLRTSCTVEERDCTVWCVSVPTAEQIIMVRRVTARTDDGSVASASPPLLVGNCLFNLPRFLQHESRDPLRAKEAHEASEKGISEWEIYAKQMYDALVANEELQARAAEQQMQHDSQLHNDDPHFESEEAHEHPLDEVHEHVQMQVTEEEATSPPVTQEGEDVRMEEQPSEQQAEDADVGHALQLEDEQREEQLQQQSRHKQQTQESASSSSLLPASLSLSDPHTRVQIITNPSDGHTTTFFVQDSEVPVSPEANGKGADAQTNSGNDSQDGEKEQEAEAHSHTAASASTPASSSSSASDNSPGIAQQQPS